MQMCENNEFTHAFSADCKEKFRLKIRFAYVLGVKYLYNIITK